MSSPGLFTNNTGVKNIFDISTAALNILAIFFSKSFKTPSKYLYLMGSRAVSSESQAISLSISLTFNLYIFSNLNFTRYASVLIPRHSLGLDFRGCRERRRGSSEDDEQQDWPSFRQQAPNLRPVALT